MTPQEQQMIQSLITRINQTRLSGKDADAERLLQQTLGQNPDSLYILSQTVLVQDYALQQAQKQLTELRQQLEPTQQPPQQHTSFLGSLFGHSDPPPPPRATSPQPTYNQQPPAYTPVPGYGQASSYAMPTGNFGSPAPASGGGFLHGAMQTAAGVAAGALAFEGVESLMHGFGGSGGYGAGGFGGGQPREEIVNNYYGDSDRGESDRKDGDRSDFDTAADTNGSLSPDVEDRRDDFASDQDDSNTFDSNDSDTADLGSDDSGSFDDSGFSGGDNNN